MNADRFVFTSYCDDVRQELGGKFSLMGIYGADLVAQGVGADSSSPVVLPKLCAYVRIVTPIDRPFERLVFRATLNDDTLIEVALQNGLEEGLPKPPPGTEGRTLAAAAVLTFAPFVVPDGSGTLRVTVETEEGVILGNGLRLQIQRTPAETH